MFGVFFGGEAACYSGGGYVGVFCVGEVVIVKLVGGHAGFVMGEQEVVDEGFAGGYGLFARGEVAQFVGVVFVAAADRVVYPNHVCGLVLLGHGVVSSEFQVSSFELLVTGCWLLRWDAWGVLVAGGLYVGWS